MKYLSFGNWVHIRRTLIGLDVVDGVFDEPESLSLTDIIFLLKNREIFDKEDLLEIKNDRIYDARYPSIRFPVANKDLTLSFNKKLQSTLEFLNSGVEMTLVRASPNNEGIVDLLLSLDSLFPNNKMQIIIAGGKSNTDILMSNGRIRYVDLPNTSWSPIMPAKLHIKWKDLILAEEKKEPGPLFVSLGHWIGTRRFLDQTGLQIFDSPFDEPESLDGDDIISLLSSDYNTISFTEEADGRVFDRRFPSIRYMKQYSYLSENFFPRLQKLFKLVQMGVPLTFVRTGKINPYRFLACVDSLFPGNKVKIIVSKERILENFCYEARVKYIKLPCDAYQEKYPEDIGKQWRDALLKEDEGIYNIVYKATDEKVKNMLETLDIGESERREDKINIDLATIPSYMKMGTDRRLWLNYIKYMMKGRGQERRIVRIKDCSGNYGLADMIRGIMNLVYYQSVYNYEIIFDFNEFFSPYFDFIKLERTNTREIVLTKTETFEEFKEMLDVPGDFDFKVLSNCIDYEFKVTGSEIDISEYIRPSELTLNRIRELLPVEQEYGVLHFRVGDIKIIGDGGCIGNRIDNTDSLDIEKSLKYCHEIITRELELPIVFCSDYPPIREIAKTKGCIVADIIPVHTGTDSGKDKIGDSIIEFYLMSRGKKIYSMVNPKTRMNGNYWHFAAVTGKIPFQEIRCPFYIEDSRNRVIITGTCRDLAKYLPKVMENIRMIGSFFEEYKCIFVESNSSDNTFELLEQLSPEGSIVKSMGQLKQERRTERIAICRNECMKIVREQGSYKYLLIIDMDNIGASLTNMKGVMSNFTIDMEWSVMTASNPNYYYDIWALRWPGVIDYDCWEAIAKDGNVDLHCKSMQKHAAKPIDTPPTLVNSAFHGAAFYKLDDIKPCCSYIGVKDGRETCEHVSFHECIRSHGGKIYINHAFVIN